MEEQKIRILEKFQRILSVSVLALMISLVTKGCWENHKTSKSIEYINEIVAGEDGVIDSKESYLFLKATRYPDLENNNPIRSDRERIYLDTGRCNLTGKLIDVYIGTEPFRGRHPDCRYIGTVDRSVLEDAVKKEF